MKKLLFILLVCCLSTNVLANIVGNYKCNALDPATGKTYQSILQVRQNGAVYNLKWSFSDHKKTDSTALLTTDKDVQVISAVFMAERAATTHSTESNKHFGLIQYQVMAKQFPIKLIGNWIFAGTTDVGNEECSKVE